MVETLIEVVFTLAILLGLVGLILLLLPSPSVLSDPVPLENEPTFRTNQGRRLQLLYQKGEVPPEDLP